MTRFAIKQCGQLASARPFAPRSGGRKHCLCHCRRSNTPRLLWPWPRSLLVTRPWENLVLSRESWEWSNNKQHEWLKETLHPFKISWVILQCMEYTNLRRFALPNSLWLSKKMSKPSDRTVCARGFLLMSWWTLRNCTPDKVIRMRFVGLTVAHVMLDVPLLGSRGGVQIFFLVAPGIASTARLCQWIVMDFGDQPPVFVGCAFPCRDIIWQPTVGRWFSNES